MGQAEQRPAVAGWADRLYEEDDLWADVTVKRTLAAARPDAPVSFPGIAACHHRTQGQTNIIMRWVTVEARSIRRPGWCRISEPGIARCRY
jgi:hypothetical protein